MKRMLPAALAAAICLLSPVFAQAQTPSGEGVEQVRATVLNLIRALVDQGVITAGKAQEMLRQAGIDPSVLSAPQVTPAVPPESVATEPARPVIRVPYIPETVKDELRNQVKQEVLAQARAERWGDPGALPSWLSRFTLYGDLRVRLQQDRYAGGNALPLDIDSYYQLPPGTTQATTGTRDRLRVRARLGFDVKLADEFKAGMRLAAVQGPESSQNPLSYNVDTGRYGRAYGVGLNLAYLEWDSKYQTTLQGGRINNPYFATDLVWAQELTIDGIAAGWKPVLSDEFGGFLTAGIHPLRLSHSSPLYNTAPDQWVWAAQGGGTWTGFDESHARLGAAIYGFEGVQGQLNPVNPIGNTLNNQGAPLFRQLGNTMFNVNFVSNPAATPVYALASQFRLVDATFEYQWARFDPLWLGVTGEWVRNIGFDAGQIRQRLGPAIVTLPQDASGRNGIDRPRVNGYQVALQAGSRDIVHWGDWQVFGGYRYLERDAVPDFLTSPDYRAGAGGTDLKSTIVGANVGVATGTSVSLKYIMSKSIDAVPQYWVDSLWLDVMGRF